MTNDDLESLWPYVLTVLPEDLGVSALDCGALSRARKVRDAEGLLRIVLVYALSDLSLKDVAAWATAAQIAELTGPALHYRLEHAESWLSSLLAQVLAEEVAPAPNRGLRARVVDATVLTGPGAIGTEWRVHALADPQTGTLTAVDVTDASGGETLARHPLGPGDVVLGGPRLRSRPGHRGGQSSWRGGCCACKPPRNPPLRPRADGDRRSLSRAPGRSHRGNNMGRDYPNTPREGHAVPQELASGEG